MIRVKKEKKEKKRRLSVYFLFAFVVKKKVIEQNINV